MRKYILLDENTDHGDKQPIFESQFCPSLVKETLNSFFMPQLPMV